jgi:F0F1-type ATP synthase membrane subunit b/b'
MTVEEKNTALFGGLVTMFQAAALQQMGKVKNPMTDKIERDLEQAQMSIDMLDMLQQKTKGNLTKEEEQFLVDVLRDLKLNYVDEKAKGTPGPAEKP